MLCVTCSLLQPLAHCRKVWFAESRRRLCPHCWHVSSRGAAGCRPPCEPSTAVAVFLRPEVLSPMFSAFLALAVSLVVLQQQSPRE